MVTIEEGRVGDHCAVRFSYRMSIHGGKGAYDLNCTVPGAAREGVFGH